MGVLYDLAARMGHAQSAVARIDELNEQAFKIRVSDSILALEVSKEIVELAREAGYTKGLAYGLRTLGFCQMRLSKNEEALIYLNEAMSLFEPMESFNETLETTSVHWNFCIRDWNSCDR
jgi:hypothetical protein